MQLNRLAFTLIELLVVIAVIGILSGLIVVSMSGTNDKATIAKAQVFSNSLRNSLMSNIVSEWKFDGNISDSWSGGNSGTLKENGYLGVCDPTHCPQFLSNDCVYGSCLSFDGSNDYVEFSANSNLTFTNGLTFAVWVKPTLSSDANAGHIFRREGASSIYGWYLLRQTGFNFQLQVLDHGATNTSTLNTTNYVVSAGKWVYLVATTDGTTMKIYINGNLNNSTNDLTGDSLGDPSRLILIGSFGGTANFFNGVIDEFRVYSIVVPVSQIKEQYYLGLNSLLINGSINKEEYISRIGESLIALDNN